jgi:predicted dehydrogenase
MVTIGQIGVGYWGPNLLRNLMVNKRCRVKQVADLSPERLDFVNKLYPAVETTASFEAILADPAIEAVVIATPVATHFEMASQVLQAGKHILVEKPIAKSKEEVARLGDLGKRQGKIVMAGHTFIFNDAVRYIKKLIDTGELGEVRYIYSQRLNLGRIRSDVDALWNFAPHDISIIQYWLGDPTPISLVRRGIDYIQGGVEDVVFLNIMYPGKVMANIHVSWLDPHRTRSMVIVGSRKMVVYDDTAENKIAIFDKGIDRRAVLGEHMDFDTPHFPIFDHRSGDIVLPQIKFKEPLQVEINHFLDCIENEVPCLTGIDHALKVVDILEKASNQPAAC